MRKAALAITIASCAFLAQAQESDAVFLGASPDVSVYLYPNTVRITNSGLVQAWSLYDMNSQQFINNVYLRSVKSLNVVNCHDRRIGILNDIYYSQRGGKGEVVWNGTVEMSEIKWQHVPPKSMSELKFDFICDIAGAIQRKR
ncbi:MAG: surface-adhesin E family protein [Gammaproteobacteria bacterium]|nr:surface-adhesin E family protein [Gammaproteobacteria bacterium]MBU1967648.1 surface-adhesin E family protein [Gammaproteobacteria bacterium]